MFPIANDTGVAGGPDNIGSMSTDGAPTSGGAPAVGVLCMDAPL